MRICLVETCSNRTHSKGMCKEHYGKWWRHHREKHCVRPPCKIECCDREATRRGWCSMHWKRWYRYGDPNYTSTEKHGKRWTKEYRIWGNMKTRCSNENVRSYKDYGGRGITICDNWINSFNNFFKDMGECPSGMTLERIDNDGPYNKENCKWATTQEQGRNNRHCKLNEYKVREIMKLIAANTVQRNIAEIYGVTRSAISGIASGRNWKGITTEKGETSPENKP